MLQWCQVQFHKRIQAYTYAALLLGEDFSSLGENIVRDTTVLWWKIKLDKYVLWHKIQLKIFISCEMPYFLNRRKRRCDQCIRCYHYMTPLISITWLCICIYVNVINMPYAHIQISISLPLLRKFKRAVHDISILFQILNTIYVCIHDPQTLQQHSCCE